MSTAPNNQSLVHGFSLVLLVLSICVFFPRTENSSTPVFSTASGPFVNLNKAPNGSLILTPRWVPRSVLGQLVHGLQGR